jgi:hypothetical protein
MLSLPGSSLPTLDQMPPGGLPPAANLYQRPVDANRRLVQTQTKTAMTRYAPSLSRLMGPALLAFALMTPGAGAAPQSLGTITGQVFTANGFAVPGARVMLQASDGTAPRTTLTDAKGRFSFSLLSAGLYDIRAYSQGRSSEWRQNVGVDARGRRTIALHLGSKKPAPIKAPASLKTPSPASGK